MTNTMMIESLVAMETEQAFVRSLKKSFLCKQRGAKPLSHGQETIFLQIICVVIYKTDTRNLFY